MIKLKDGRAELYQWDTGRVLSVPKECTEVHYSNKLFGRSLDVEVVDGTAIIPDLLLQTAKPISVWCFVGTAENGFTKVSKQFEVVPRNKPADYVFTPTEQLTLREIEERVEALEKGGGGSATPGEDGEPGGYYTPSVTQPNTNTMRMEFAASKADMPPVDGVEIALPGGGSGLTSTEKNHLLTILDAVIVETTKQPVVAEALAALKQLWSGGAVYVSQNGTTLVFENMATVTSITQNGSVLALA